MKQRIAFAAHQVKFEPALLPVSAELSPRFTTHRVEPAVWPVKERDCPAASLIVSVGADGLPAKAGEAIGAPPVPVTSESVSVTAPVRVLKEIAAAPRDLADPSWPVR